jgi:copper oxidase (laccase) domain-containing protein
MIPTESHTLWGGAVEVHCFGTRYLDRTEFVEENWSLAGKTPEEAEENNPGILDRMERIATRFFLQTIYAPHPSTFNAEIADPRSDEWRRWPSSLVRGPLADGVVLREPGTAFVVSSGDCPTVILRDTDSGDVVAAHAGRDSLIKLDDSPHLISSMVAVLRPKRGAKAGIRAFIACGINYEHFTHPWNDPQNGERNRAMHAHAAEYEGAAFADDEDGLISLKDLITGQLISNGLNDTRIGFDGADTYSDLGADGKPLWHSHRRGDRTRNLVLVIRHW